MLKTGYEHYTGLWPMPHALYGGGPCDEQRHLPESAKKTG